jgi:hypothetical protein
MLQRLLIDLAPARREVTGHALYSSIQTVEDLRVFMEMHVFAVWDFMSLLKALQRGLTCVETPWIPARHASSRLINSIVLDEESDSGLDGNPISHFDLYRDAMRACGASTGTIDSFIEQLRSGSDVACALRDASVPGPARDFVSSTFAIISRGKLHEIAAAFTIGREDVIPDMFRVLVAEMARGLPGLEIFHYYLQRHIELDGDDHGPLAHRMLESLCGDDDRKWAEATAAAKEALHARCMLWDGIASRMPVQASV